MRKMCLAGMKEAISGSGMQMQLEYYLLEEMHYHGSKEVLLYGIEVAKNQEIEREVESIRGISHSKEEALRILHTLMKHTVTPYVTAETIDDLMSLAL